MTSLMASYGTDRHQQNLQIASLTALCGALQLHHTLHRAHIPTKSAFVLYVGRHPKTACTVHHVGFMNYVGQTPQDSLHMGFMNYVGQTPQGSLQKLPSLWSFTEMTEPTVHCRKATDTLCLVTTLAEAPSPVAHHNINNVCSTERGENTFP